MFKPTLESSKAASHEAELLCMLICAANAYVKVITKEFPNFGAVESISDGS